MKRLRAALPLILLLLAGVTLYASGALDRFNPQHLVAHQHQIRMHIAEHPWLSRLTYIGLLTLGMATGIPGTIVIILAGGYAFGVVDGTLCSSAGLTLGTLILYLASRYAFGTGSKHPPAIVAKLHHGFERHPVSYTLFLRFVPVMPFGAVTVGLAWLRCPLWLFLGASWLGGTVSLVFESSIGAGLGDALDQDGALNAGLLMHASVLLPMGALAVLALLPLLIGRLTRHRRQAPPDRQG
ncbi:VTT domain-containing protein [Rhodanobacter sp. DHB23]|uniref:TVP38/TMEM64 family protein n=1 Tax=Rhodanobacter sp. DHB23 TaxID=2775923 RepID=UPI00177D4FF1|nr:VTT domain-containing protein [Rhodanobacter sp. DHB23]MBD8872267.1 TVP38/TMEM64 family protein [Rhodanobacter sp. DHB23]